MKYIIENKNKLFLGALVGIIVIMIVQNYFLVRKNEQYLKRIEALTEGKNRRNTLSEGDSLRVFTALNLDSSALLIDPRSDHGLTIFFVFTTWCPVCLDNVGPWNRVMREAPSEGIQIIGLSPDSLSKIREYSLRVGLLFPVYSVAIDSSFTKDFKIHSVPQTIVVDASGRVKKIWEGFLSDDRIDTLKTTVRISLSSRVF